jgi:sensor histidine kinase YesM
MKGIGDKFIGDNEHFSFEQRMFNFAMLLGICMTTFGTVMDLYYGTGIMIDLFFVGCWTLTYYLSRFRSCFRWVSIVGFGVFVFAFFPYYWISSGGSISIIPYYAIVFIAIISIILSGRFRIMMVLSMLTVEMLLICLDAHKTGSLEIVYHQNLFGIAIQLFVIMFAMAALIIVYSNTYMAEKARSETYARTIEEHYHQQLYYMENLEQLIYKLKSERHDFNNHLGVIYGLLEGGETDRARNYTTQLVKTAEEYQNITNIPYSMVRAMLNYKLSAARESKIELRLNINVPAELKLDEFDLTVILGNLLDNAMEACAAIEENGRYIDLGIFYKPDYLIIQVENPTHGDLLSGGNHTTKPDAGDHGFGLRNIEYLANKHNGLLQIEPADGVFKVSIALLVDAAS